ncbi:conjugal transfer protein TraF, partial [Reinekea sp.]|uniref:conjugal transfer protein TraF n=1 Tax=Reinekea sp. TaxID=1970455 RepID=UPI00257B2EBC
GFGAIANDFLEEDIINRGVDIFSTVEDQVSGDDGLTDLGEALQVSVAGLAFTPTFSEVVIADVSAAATPAALITNLGVLETSLGLVETDISGLRNDLADTRGDETSLTPTGLAGISSDTSKVNTQVATLRTTTTASLTEVTDDLISWLESFATKDAYVEASVLPISFALPSRNFGFGLHLSNSIQVGAALNLSAEDTTFLGEAVEDSNGLISTASGSIEDVALTISNATGSTGTLDANLGTVDTDLVSLSVSITALKENVTDLKELSQEILDDQGGIPTGAQSLEIARIQGIINDDDDSVVGSIAQVNTAQKALTGDVSTGDAGSVADVATSVAELTALSGDFTAALATVTTYDGPNGIIVDGTPAVSTDDLTSTVRVALAAIQEVGVSVAKEVVIQGQTVSIGLTPKLQVILIEDQSFGVEAVDTSGIGQDLTPIVKANLDIGIAKEWDFHGRVKAGATIKNIIPYTVTSPLGVEVNLRPKMRLGVSHHTDFSTVGVDLDVTNNSAFYFGIPTRELSMGGELSLWGHAALRAGARWNVSDPAETGVFTTGLGLTPFGTGLNLAFWVPFDAFSADYGQVIADISDGELSSALTTGDQLLRDFGLSVNLQVSW